MTWYCYLQSLHIRTEQLNYWKKNSQNILHVLSEFVTFGGSTFIGVLGCMKSEGCIFGGRTIDRTKWQREIHSLPWGFGMGHLSLWSSRHCAISCLAFGHGVKPCHRFLWVSALQTSQFPSSHGPVFVSMVMNESPTGSGHYQWWEGLFTGHRALYVEGENWKGDNRRMGKRRKSCRHTFSGSTQQTHWRLGRNCNFFFFTVLLTVRLLLDHSRTSDNVLSSCLDIPQGKSWQWVSLCPPKTARES